MNIIFIADVSINEVIGGAERVLWEQATRLQNRGHIVRVLTRMLPSHACHNQCIGGVQEVRYEVNRKNPILYILTTYFNSRKAYRKLLSERHIDCANFHQPFSAFGLTGYNANKNIKKIYTCHSLSHEEYISRNPKPLSVSNKFTYILNIWFRKWIEKRTLNSSTHIIVLSQYTKCKLNSIYGISSKKISIIEGGVDIKQFTPAQEKEPIRKALNIPIGQTVLFTLRNLVNRMGLETLIEAFVKVSNEIEEIHLVIGGTGILKEKLFKSVTTKGIAHRITFAGFINEEVLPNYYRMADLFVLPTKELEGFGLITIESMASGVPVVGTPIGGTKEILDRFDPSFLFEDASPEAMSKLIIEKCWIIKHTPEAWAEIGRRCRTFVEENYSWERNIDLLETLMSDGREKKNRNLPRNSQRSLR